jgi:ATP-binding cassette subfamily B protein
MDSTLALVMLATFPLIFITIYLISRNGLPLYERVQKSVDAMVGVVREDTQGIRVIKALSKNDYENRRFDNVNRTLSRQECRAGTVMSSTNPIMTLLMNLGIAGVVALSAHRVAAGTSSVSTVIAFMQYFTTISMAMMALSRIFVMFTKCSASAKRVEEVLSTPDRFETVPDECDGSDNHVEFKNVSFSYFGKRNNLDNISFSLKRGERLGIIGATGSGKSTLTRLLMRTYDCDSGDIRIDGKSIKSYTRAELTQKFGIAMQHDFLYADTIRENIDFARGLTDEKIQRAARIAQAEEFILSKEGGYLSVLAQKGTNLSGGQRQRLLIARAIAAEPDIIILDDSSSALDYKTDAALRRALSESLSESTVITVAQRVSSVKDCDLILVLEDGRIIGKGTHAELLESCPEYREISDSQMGGAFVE